MAGAQWYGQAGYNIAGSLIDWINHPIKLSLHTSTYTPWAGTHDFYDDAIASECSGTNYTAGGATLASKTRTFDLATKMTVLGCANITFSNITVSGIRYAVVYRNTGTPSTSPLIGFIDYLADQNPVSQDFVIIINPTVGFFRLTAA